MFFSCVVLKYPPKICIERTDTLQSIIQSTKNLSEYSILRCFSGKINIYPVVYSEENLQVRVVVVPIRARPWSPKVVSAEVHTQRLKLTGQLIWWSPVSARGSQFLFWRHPISPGRRAGARPRPRNLAGDAAGKCRPPLSCCSSFSCRAIWTRDQERERGSRH